MKEIINYGEARRQQILKGFTNIEECVEETPIEKRVTVFMLITLKTVVCSAWDRNMVMPLRKSPRQVKKAARVYPRGTSASRTMHVRLQKRPS